MTLADIARHLADGTRVNVVLLDFEKAFHNASHSTLLYKLTTYTTESEANSAAGLGPSSATSRLEGVKQCMPFTPISVALNCSGQMMCLSSALRCIETVQ